MTLPVRLGRPSDMAFVVDMWRRTYLDGLRVKGSPLNSAGAPHLVGIDRDYYFPACAKVISSLCERGTVRVAHAPDDDDHLIGFVVYAGSTFHYAAVKPTFYVDLNLDELLRGVEIDAYSHRCPYLERVLASFRGAHFTSTLSTTGNLISKWHPPTGWRYTPRI